MSSSCSRRGHAGAPALHQVDDQRDVHRALDGRAAALALALPVVPVADGEQRARHVDAQVAGGARAHLRGVHVAAERVGHEARAHLAARRGHADRAQHRGDRQVEAEVLGLVAHGACGPVELVDPGALGQGLLQERRAVGAGERAEERDRGGRRPVARGPEVGDVDGEGVARLGALHVEGPGLRVDLGHDQHLGGPVGGALQASGEGVLRPEPQRRARGYPVGRGDPAERPGELVRRRPELHDVHPDDRRVNSAPGPRFRAGRSAPARRCRRPPRRRSPPRRRPSTARRTRCPPGTGRRPRGRSCR